MTAAAVSPLVTARGLGIYGRIAGLRESSAWHLRESSVWAHAGQLFVRVIEHVGQHSLLGLPAIAEVHAIISVTNPTLSRNDLVAITAEHLQLGSYRRKVVWRSTKRLLRSRNSHPVSGSALAFAADQDRGVRPLEGIGELGRPAVAARWLLAAPLRARASSSPPAPPPLPTRPPAEKPDTEHRDVTLVARDRRRPPWAIRYLRAWQCPVRPRRYASTSATRRQRLSRIWKNGP